MNVCLVCNNGVIPGEAEPRSRIRVSGVEKSPSVASLIEHAKTTWVCRTALGDLDSAA